MGEHAHPIIEMIYDQIILDPLSENPRERAGAYAQSGWEQEARARQRVEAALATTRSHCNALATQLRQARNTFTAARDIEHPLIEGTDYESYYTERIEAIDRVLEQAERDGVL